MAEAFLRHHGGEKYDVYSVGIDSKGVHPMTIAVMNEIGIDISADAKRIHRWLFEDPVRVEGTDAEKLAKFREVRDQIEARVKLWLAETAEVERIPDA